MCQLFFYLMREAGNSPAKHGHNHSIFCHHVKYATTKSPAASHRKPFLHYSHMKHFGKSNFGRVKDALINICLPDFAFPQDHWFYALSLVAFCR